MDKMENSKSQYQVNSENNNDEKDDAMLLFQDDSTECAICLGPLNDPEKEVIQLTTCGHRWHLECLQDQLAHAQPNPAQRLVLTGCRWYV